MYEGYSSKQEYFDQFEDFKIEVIGDEVILKEYIGNKTKVEIPEGVTIIDLLQIESYVEEVKLPDTVKSIKPAAFRSWSSLKKVILPNQLDELGEATFSNCPQLELVTTLEHENDNDNISRLPAGIKVIKEELFFQTPQIKNILLPESIEEIEQYAFASMAGLERIIIPSRTEKIGKLAFSGCINLKEVILPRKMTVIEEETFKQNVQLENLVLPESIQDIEARAFLRCKKIKKITIPNGVKKVDPSILFGCDSLAIINLPITTEEIDYGLYTSPTLFLDHKELKLKGLFDLDTIVYEYSIENEVLTRNITVNNIPFKRIVGKVNFFEKGSWINYIDLEPLEDNEILKSIIKNTPEDKLKSNFWEKINLEELKKNIDLFRMIGIPENEIANIFVNNNNFFSCSFDNVLENLSYLSEQKIISPNDLQKLFFEVNVDNNNSLNGKTKDEQKNILKHLLTIYYQSYKKLPILLNRLATKTTPKEQLDLRDALINISQMELIDFDNMEKIKHARKIFNRNVFDYISEEDELTFKKDLGHKRKTYLEYDVKYDKYFLGIKSPFYRKLTGINENLFEYFLDAMSDKNITSEFKKFFDSLTTVQNWNKFSSEKERAILLKNEIIGRILYGCLAYEQNTSVAIANIQKNDFMNILKSVTGNNTTLFTDRALVEKMLTIDPYSFDALRNDNHELEYKYCEFAKTKGYLFSCKEIEEYLRKKTPQNNMQKLNHYNDFIHYIEYINNEIGIPKIAKEDRAEYLRKTRIIAKRFLHENGIEDLNNLLRLTDLYLRANAGYLSISAKGEIIEKTAKVVFDSKNQISQTNKLLYMMYNLNKLAHNVTDLNLKVDFVNNRTTNKEELKNIEQAVKALDELSRFGFNLSIVDGIVSFNTENDTVTEDDYSPLKRLIRDGNDDSRLIDKLQDLVSNKYTNTINLDTIEVIRSNLNTLLSLSATGFLNQTNKEKIRNYAEERALFFDVKAIVAEELLNLEVEKMKSDIYKFIGMTTEEKKQFYNEKGYIMEIQKDEGNAILVCYSKMYRETFSIHLKNMNHDLHNAVYTYLNSSSYTETLSNTKLRPPGLSMRTNKYEPCQSDKPLTEVLTAGFNGDVNEDSVALYNYIEYDLYYQIKELRENQQKIKEGTCDISTLEYFETLDVDKWFKPFEEIGKLSIAYIDAQGRKSTKSVNARIKEQPTGPSDIHCLGVKAKDIKTYKYEIKKKLAPSQPEQRTITTDERTVTELKSLNLNFGTLKTGIKKEEAETPKKK